MKLYIALKVFSYLKRKSLDLLVKTRLTGCKLGDTSTLFIVNYHLMIILRIYCNSVMLHMGKLICFTVIRLIFPQQYKLLINICRILSRVIRKASFVYYNILIKLLGRDTFSSSSVCICDTYYARGSLVNRKSKYKAKYHCSQYGVERVPSYGIWL